MTIKILRFWFWAININYLVAVGDWVISTDTPIKYGLLNWVVWFIIIITNYAKTSGSWWHLWCLNTLTIYIVKVWRFNSVCFSVLCHWFSSTNWNFLFRKHRCHFLSKANQNQYYINNPLSETRKKNTMRFCISITILWSAAMRRHHTFEHLLF